MKTNPEIEKIRIKIDKSDESGICAFCGQLAFSSEHLRNHVLIETSLINIRSIRMSLTPSRKARKIRFHDVLSSLRPPEEDNIPF